MKRLLTAWLVREILHLQWKSRRKTIAAESASEGRPHCEGSLLPPVALSPRRSA